MDGTGTILYILIQHGFSQQNIATDILILSVKKSYNSVGKNKKVDKSIILYASDAAWVYNNCKNKTVLEIVKGSKERPTSTTGWRKD